MRLRIREWGLFVLILFFSISTISCATPLSNKLAKESDVDVHLSEQPRSAPPVVAPKQPQPEFEQQPAGKR